MIVFILFEIKSGLKLFKRFGFCENFTKLVS